MKEEELIQKYVKAYEKPFVDRKAYYNSVLTYDFIVWSLKQLNFWQKKYFVDETEYTLLDDKPEEFEKVTRLEVIRNDRILVKYLAENKCFNFSFQDDGRTLKIFIREKKYET